MSASSGQADRFIAGSLRCGVILALLAPTAALAQSEEGATRQREEDPPHANQGSSVADQEAELRARMGRLALRRGDLEAARVDLQRAQQLDPGPERLMELAAALEALRQDEELVRAYRVYLRRAPDGERVEEVRARLAILTRAREVAAPPSRAVADEAAAGPDEPSQDEGGRTVFEEAWFYVVVGLVALSVIAGVAAATSEDTPAVTSSADDGVATHALLAW